MGGIKIEADSADEIRRLLGVDREIELQRQVQESEQKLYVTQLLLSQRTGINPALSNQAIEALLLPQHSPQGYPTFPVAPPPITYLPPPPPPPAYLPPPPPSAPIPVDYGPVDYPAQQSTLMQPTTVVQQSNGRSLLQFFLDWPIVCLLPLILGFGLFTWKFNPEAFNYWKQKMIPEQTQTVPVPAPPPPPTNETPPAS